MINGVSPMTRKDLAGTSNISNLYCFNIVLHQRTLKDFELDANLRVQHPHSSNTASFVRWKIGSLMMPLLTY